ncbi:MAG: GFA family protein [bacterium]
MKAPTTPVTGGCLCGRVRYEAEVFLHNGYICHCTICQKSTGQPAEITVLIKAGTLHFTAEPPTFFNSSDFGRRGFCGTCGSRLVWQAQDPAEDWTTNLSVGSLDAPAAVRVTCHIYADTQLPWYNLRDDLPKFFEADAEAMMDFIRLEDDA